MAGKTRVSIRVMTDKKTSVINISDLNGCANAKGLNGKDALLLRDLSEFLADVHEDSEDAGLVDLTPENVSKVLQPPAEKEEEKTA